MALPRLPPRIATALPLVVMAFLAALTYWYLQSTLHIGAPVSTKALQHTPDYYANDFAVTMLTDTGTVKYRLNAATMLHYEDDDNTDLTNPAMRGFPLDAPIVTATAKRGVVNADGSIINMYDDARIVRAPGPADPPMQADSQHFLILANDDVIKTELPVKLTRGDSVATGNGMIYTNTTRNGELLGQVRGSIAASQFNGGPKQ